MIPFSILLQITSYVLPFVDLKLYTLFGDQLLLVNLYLLNYLNIIYTWIF